MNTLSQQAIEEINSLLFQVSTLTELAEKQSADFFHSVRKWIKAVETVFIQNKITLGAEIATFNAILISVEHDGLIPETLAFYREPSHVKLKRAAATVFLQKTVELIYNYLLKISGAFGTNTNLKNNPPK